MDKPQANGMPDLERRLAPFYPAFIALGILFFVVGMLSDSAMQRGIALVWLVVVPLWIFRYRAFRRSSPAGRDSV